MFHLRIKNVTLYNEFIVFKNQDGSLLVLRPNFRRKSHHLPSLRTQINQNSHPGLCIYILNFCLGMDL